MKTEMKQGHTPTPWTAYANSGFPKLLQIRTVGGSIEIATISRHAKSAEEAEENAAFIVRAVNAHEELLEAAKAALKCLDQVQGADRIGIKLSAAIAKAEE